MISCNFIKDGQGAATSASGEEMALLLPKAGDFVTLKTCEAFLKCLKVSEISSASSTMNEFKIEVHAPVTDHDARIKDVLDSLQKACLLEDPLPEIMLALESIKRLCAADICFRPLLRDIDELMLRFTHCQEETRQLLISLLWKVFSQEMTPGEGHKLVGDLFYEIEPLRIRSLVKYITIPYEVKFLVRTLVPRLFASSLFLKDGSFDSGIIRMVKNFYVLFSGESSRVFSQDKHHISSVLQELVDDERIGRFLEHIAAPQKGSDGEELVNIILGCPLNQECSIQNTQIALLSSLLTWWRQDDVGNCYIVARHLELREGRVLQYLEELYELISKGFLTRFIGGREIHLFGLACAKSQACSTPMAECSQRLFNSPAVQTALRLLGCETEKEAREIWVSLPKQKSHSLDELLEKIASIHGSQKNVSKARLLIESAGQDVLGQLWENAVASEAIMQWPLLQKYLATLGHDFIQKHYLGEADMLETALPKIVSQICQKHESIGFTVIPQGEEHDCSMVPYIEREHKPELFDSVDSFSQYIHKLDMDLYALIAASALSSNNTPPFNPEDSRNRFLHFLQHKLINSPCKNMLDKPGEKEILGITSTCPFVQIHLPPHVYALQKLIPFTTIPIPHEYCLEAWLSEFFKEKERLQAIHGTDPSFSALALAPGDAHESGLAHGRGHLFRFLPFHSSIAGIKNLNDLLRRKGLIIQALKKPRFTPKAAQVKLKESLALYFVAPPSDVVDHSFEGLAEKELYSTEEIIGRLLDTFMNWEKSPVFSNPDKAMRIEHYIFILTTCLVQDEPDFANQFLHFADMNWEQNGKALHAALWLDPETKQWKIVQVTEDDKPFTVYGAEEIKDLIYFSQIADVTPKEYVEQKRTKQLQAFEQKSAKKLQKIEQTFLDAWYELKRYLDNLGCQEKEAVSKEILYCQTHPPFIVQACSEEKVSKLHALVQKPASWRQPFEVCLKLMALYQRVLKSRLELDQGSMEFHRTRAFKPTGFLSLLESPEEGR